MLFNNVAIESIAYSLAPHRITSAELEEQLAPVLERHGVRRGLLEAVTGIRTRGFWDRGTQPSEVATRAARIAIDRAAMAPDDLGCLINTSVCRDYIEPSVACLVHGNLQLGAHCVNFDITNACLGFLNGMATIALMIETGQIRHGIVVAGESTRECIEATIQRLLRPETTREEVFRNLASLTLGSGAAAMVLAHRDVSRTGHQLNGHVDRAATQHNRICVGQMDYMHADPVAMQAASAILLREAWTIAEEQLPNWTHDAIDHYVPHQVSSRNSVACAAAVGIDLAKTHLILTDYGNTGPVGLPTSLAMAADAGRIGPGEHLALIGFGSGLNCMLMSVTWGS